MTLISYECSKCKNRFKKIEDAQFCEKNHKCNHETIEYSISADTHRYFAAFSRCTECYDILYWHPTNDKDGEFILITQEFNISVLAQRDNYYQHYFEEHKLRSEKVQSMIKEYLANVFKNKLKNKVKKL